MSGGLLGPYFAAKAGMDQLASAAREPRRDTAIVVPGAYTKGTNHFVSPTPPPGRMVFQTALAATDPPDSDPAEIGRTVAAIVRAPAGQRPFRTVVDPADDGAKVTFPTVDRVREQFLHRLGFAELLHPHRGNIDR